MAGLAAALLAGGPNAVASPDQAPGKHRVPVRVSSAKMMARAAQGGTTFTPVPPVRLLDTRIGTGTGGNRNPVPQATSITLDMSAVVPTTATAVVLNVTGTQPTGSTFITVYPTGQAVPNSSNLNLVPGQTRPNAVTVALGLNRSVNLYNNIGSTHLIADLAGYYTTDAGSRFTTLASPQRLLDTRFNGGGPLGPGGTRTLDFSFLPATATSVTFNLTGVDATASTFVVAFPDGTTRPDPASNLNLAPGDVSPNLVTVKLGTNRRVQFYNNAGSTHLVVDLAGYYATDQGGFFFETDPTRVLDTRIQPPSLTPDIVIVLTGWPNGVTSVVANLTGTNPTASMFVAAWPGDQQQGLPSNLNLVPGQTAPNLITVGIGPDPNFGPAVDFGNNFGSVDLIVDVAGFFAPTA